MNDEQLNRLVARLRECEALAMAAAEQAPIGGSARATLLGKADGLGDALRWIARAREGRLD